MIKHIALSLIFLFAAVSFLSAQTGDGSGPIVRNSIYNDTSIPLRDMVEVPISQTNWEDGIIPVRKSTPLYGDEYEKDFSIQSFNGTGGGGTIIENFEGTPHDIYAPPDVSCSVGPNHVMQMVNVRFQIWDKSGTSLLGPVSLGTLWSGFPGPWSTSLNDGDPVVIYDEAADRWFASEFSLPNGGSGPEYILVAISQTGDPTGSWHRYGFEFADFPDYPHYGVWPDGYYMSANRFGATTGTYAAAFERAEMLNGNPAQMVFFSRTTATNWSLLPSDWDGSTAPPAGAPNYFVQAHDNARYGGTDGVDIQEFHVDWITPGNSTFSPPTFLTTSPFSEVNGIPQLGTGTTLDDLSDRMMQRLQYRNFGSHQSMVVCQTIDAGSSRAGVRWYEFRNTGGGWLVYQEGTYAPADGEERWMGSIAMNGDGDIALGYTASSSAINPEIRYTGRQNGDPLGVMTITEGTIFSSGGSQTGLSRWGDYSQMSIDPVDDQTFWYSHEYIPSNGSFNWQTRIASIIFSAPCPVGFPTNPNPADGAVDVPITLAQLSWTNGAGSTTNELWFGEVGSMALVHSGSLISSWAIPGNLSYNTAYEWRVVDMNDTCSTNGPVWGFTTEQNPDIVIDTLFFDDFESGLTLWTITNNGGTCDWLLFTPPYPNAYTLPASSSGGVLSADSDECGSGTTMNTTAAINGSFDFSTYTEMVWLEFDNDFRTIDADDDAIVEMSTDGGTTWVSIWERLGVDERNTHETVDITSAVAGQTNVQFRLISIQPGWDWWWTLDNFAIYGMYIVPVELTSFAAVISDDNVQLNWTTATEINNQGFEIQRRSGSGEFEKIGYVPGHGTTTNTQVYSYVDSKVASGNYSYRLKQIDFNGTFEYSDEVAVEVTAPLEYTLEQNYPNPFNPSTSIKYSIPEGGLVTLDVYNLLGEKVGSLVNGVQEAGRYEINFDASNLASGIYVYSLRSGSFTSVKKMLLMK